MSSRSIRFFCYLSLILPAAAFCATDSTKANRVLPVERGLYIAPLLKYRYPSIIFSGQDPAHRRLVYRPNNKFISGVRVMAFGVMAEFSAGLIPGDRSIERYGKTNASDLAINAMTRHWYGDFQWLNYEGTFFRRSWEDYARDQPLPLRSDMDIRMRSLSLTWVFRPDYFSMRSAYLFSERQVESGGSPLLRAGLTRFLVHGSGTIINSEDMEWFPDLEDVNEVTTHALGLAPGYGYTYVHRDFFINGTLLAGPAQYWIRYDLNQDGPRYDIQLNWLTSLTFSVGYNGPVFFGGISFRSQSFAVRMPESRLIANQALINTMVGYRFQEKGIFKKRLRNLPWWPGHQPKD